MIKRIVTTTMLLLLFGKLMAIEEPKYDLLEQDKSFELRAYHPMIIAQTEVMGSIDTASRKGFRRIAGYIFGDSISVQDGKQKVSMTAPVTIEPNSETVIMTEPVTLKEEESYWRIHFFMPSEYTLQSLPKPNNSQIILKEVPRHNMAVLRFSGFYSDAKIAAKTQELKEWLAKKKIHPQGKPKLARYNPPWTLPFMRRNEIMIAY